MTIYGRSEELVSRCDECDLAEPESLASLGSSAPGVVDGILSHEDDSSDDKSEIEIEPPKENGEQEIGKQDKLITTKYQMEIENRKLKGA